MKKLITLMLLVGISGSLTAQSKVKERDVVGEWELVIDIDRREIEEEIEEESNWLARRFAKSVSNFALDIVESIDIVMDFKDDGDLKITANVFGAREVEWASWYINRDGELIIEDLDDRDDDHFTLSDSDVWLFDKDEDHLVPYEKSRRGRLAENEDVYLRRR
ncbi:hypothetical protein [Roseivirga pacifica]|uniref:hypothetical protein n=1 Tax=Roseivirga pacifica TaxID=1267423 RepID=UPI003BAA1943